jgi:hypothetical protein
LNTSTLITLLVRETAVFVGLLATHTRVRPELASVTAEILREMTQLLHEQGLTQSSVAGMLNLTLRGYQRKLRRLQDGQHEPAAQSLQWQIYAYISRESERVQVTREMILHQFRGLEQPVVLGVLTELQHVGVVKRCESRHAQWYEINTEPGETGAALQDLVHALIVNRQPISEEQLRTDLRTITPAALTQILTALTTSQRAAPVEEDGVRVWRSGSILILEGDSAGWKAAVYDHLSAVLTALGTKLQLGSHPQARSLAGGATWWFEVWPGHPLNDEARGFLDDVRRRAVDLRQRIEAHNQTLTERPETLAEVRFYAGSYVRGAADLAQPEPDDAPTPMAAEETGDPS